MDTKEIEHFIYTDKICRQLFQGVYSVDNLPTRPRLLVYNTDASTKPGLHWIAIYVSKNGRGEYFDSFGRVPDRHFTTYLNEHCRIWTYSRKQLQSVVSGFCGHYCYIYCVYRS
jgi:hypothetical protein